MKVPRWKHPYHFALFFSGLFALAVSPGFAQEQPQAASSSSDRQASWESIESPENTDFWDSLLSMEQPAGSDTASVQVSPEAPLAEGASLKQLGPSRPEGEIKTASRAKEIVVVKEDGTFESHDAVQGNAGGPNDTEDQEECGGR